MIKLISTIKTIYLINRLADKPGETSRVFDIVDYLIGKYPPVAVNKIEKKLSTNLNFVNFYKKYQADKRLSVPINLEELACLNKNTLGYKFYQYIKTNNLNLKYYQPLEEKNSLYVIRNRLAKTHDIFHFLAGFNCTPVEEYGLQAFYLGQEPSMAAFCIMCAGFFRILKQLKTKEITILLDAISMGYQNGKSAKNILYIIWEDMWDKDLSEVMKEFNIKRFNNSVEII